MRKTAFAGTAILALSLLLTACGGGDQPADDMSEPTAQSQTDDMSGQDEMSDDEMSEDEMSDDMSEDDMADDMSDDMAAARTGEFTGLNDKAVSGSVEVTDTEVVLSGFSSDEAPDLHVYLTNGTEEADVEAGTEIDAVAFDEASQTFTLDGVDVADYDTVVIHCDKAKAVFGAADLA
ncbi:DM13 domain-containing protein [Promicromonospora thailandica]|uniref:Electron transfer DM13 n=1 Tax=Promicromonospora thailandica TaxID=765201 RepID=A0A9X2FZ83_9MICO|nr:DM13 domain-containing protein [Promicromonospora thailandica]MCP2262763.1 Electron transfer DM13 [Promicromonospora thailandica]BFF18088.1 hypothetical protein GCM10025730_16090 [Promicromonospora thailandica]